jgi:hypothetical protein
VRVRLDRKVTSISLLVVLGVRRDGQKVLLAVRNMGGESEAAWRAVLDDLVKALQVRRRTTSALATGARPELTHSRHGRRSSFAAGVGRIADARVLLRPPHEGAAAFGPVRAR